MSYTYGIFVKPKLYIKKQKYFKDQLSILLEKKIEKQEA